MSAELERLTACWGSLWLALLWHGVAALVYLGAALAICQGLREAHDKVMLSGVVLALLGVAMTLVSWWVEGR